MRPPLVLAIATCTWLVACGEADTERTVYPEPATDGSSGGGLADAGAAAESAGSSPEAGGECAGARVEVRQIADGTIESGTEVELDRVIATSQKFLVARGSAGSCLWGVFVSAQLSSAAAHSGVMVVAYGDSSQPRANGEFEACAPGTDALPDDVRIGDLLSIRGKTAVYEPTWCANRRVVGQPRVRALRACPVSKLGSAPPPEPLALDAETADKLAQGTDGALLRAWASVVVRMTAVSGKQDGTNPDIVGAYGTIRLNETALEVRDKISFASVGVIDGGVEFGHPTTFSRIDGLVFLEYCDWVLGPRDKCLDFDPPSADCQ